MVEVHHWALDREWAGSVVERIAVGTLEAPQRTVQAADILGVCACWLRHKGHILGIAFCRGIEATLKGYGL
eukprot:8135169-Karenia_brevis.AAC.1